MENYQNVLIPTDFSSASWKAVLAGIKLARGSRANVSILHVTNIQDDGYHDLIKEKLANLSANLSEIYDLKIQGVLEHGIVERVIYSFIEEKKIDVVVLGAKEEEASESNQLTTMIGSLNVPVMIVPAA